VPQIPAFARKKLRHLLNARKPDHNLQQLEAFEAARRAEGYREYTWQQLESLAPPNIL
jgi:hypothetical protein